MRTLYKAGNAADAWGISFDYIVVADPEIEAYLANGWVKNPLEIKVAEPVTEDAELSPKEARAYLDEHGVIYDTAAHWKTIVKLAKEHKGQA